MQAGVAITPIMPFRVEDTAALTVGDITPVTGTGTEAITSSGRFEETVPHAITIYLTFFERRKSISSSANSLRVSASRVPYGTRSVSPRKTIFSFGSNRLNSRTAVSPPSPESKTPTARLSNQISSVRSSANSISLVSSSV